MLADWAGAVFDQGDQFGVRTSGAGTHPDKDLKYLGYQIEVGQFGFATGIVRPPDFPFFDDLQNGVGVVSHEQQVPDVFPVAIKWDRPVLEARLNDERDQLFGMVKRAIVVGAIAHGDGQVIGLMPDPNQMIRGGLRG
jgi:hypothetical protein